MNHLDKKTRLLVWGLVLFTFSSSAEIPDIGDLRELFVDSYMIESMDNLSLRLHEPRREEPALHFNAPWEGRYSAYATVLNDNGLFRMYYRGLPSAEKGTSAVTCYAESRDGIHWENRRSGSSKSMVRRTTMWSSQVSTISHGASVRLSIHDREFRRKNGTRQWQRSRRKD